MEHPEERVALIEVLGRDGQVLRTVDVAHWPLSLGRALDNQVVIDDAHVAAYHARLAPDADGQLLLHALPTLNGLQFEQRPVLAPLPVPAAGGLLQLGATRLRLRLAGETLAAEQPLAPPPGRAALNPWFSGGLIVALMLANRWLALDPGADYTAWLPELLGLPGLVAGWCGLWALMSKLFQHRFDFTGHLRVALPGLLALVLADDLLQPVAAALALPLLWKLNGLLQAVLGAGLLHAHLSLLLPLHRRAVTASVGTLVVAGVALSSALTWRGSDSLVATPYMSTLPLPGLRLTGTVPTATLVQDMAPVAAALAARVQKAQADDDAEGDPSE